MNTLKNLFDKVFRTPPEDATEDLAKKVVPFEWNPEEEAVAPTSATAASWKRGNTPDAGPARVHGEATDADISASAHNLPTPVFEKNTPVVSQAPPAATSRPAWKDSPSTAVPPAEEAPFVSIKPAAVAPVVVAPAPSRDLAQAAPASIARTSPDPPSAVPVVSTPPPLPLSDFEEVYRKAGIKSPVHGYGVERVYRLLTSRRLVGLDRSVRRSALLTALDAAGVPPSDVSQDAVLRRKALTAYEAEKALELQSLRSRNESRVEALQDTVETFTRQKQSQIERLAQGSTSAVRAQSDLEIRKRMEQDRLYRSLAYFLEPLPPPSAYSAPQVERGREVVEIRPSSTESPTGSAIDLGATMEGMIEAFSPEPHRTEVAEEDAEIVVESDDLGASTLPISQSALEMALRATAEEARTLALGSTTNVEDRPADAVAALRKLREDKRTDSGS